MNDSEATPSSAHPVNASTAAIAKGALGFDGRTCPPLSPAVIRFYRSSTEPAGQDALYAFKIYAASPPPAIPPGEAERAGKERKGAGKRYGVDLPTNLPSRELNGMEVDVCQPGKEVGNLRREIGPGVPLWKIPN